MKTKIVYAVTSDDTDIYLEQTLVSAYSVKLHNPNATIVLVVDFLTNTTIVGRRSTILKYITEKVVVNVPEKYNKMERSRYVKTYIRDCVKGDFLFIDTDTVVVSSLEEVDLFSFDVAACKDKHLNMSVHPLQKSCSFQCRKIGIDLPDVYFNSGVIYAKDNETSHRLFSRWHSLYLQGTGLGIMHDQPALAKADFECGHIIREMDGVWNCQINYHGLPYLYESRIIHYIGSAKKYHSPTCYFYYIDIYKEIKQTGILSDLTCSKIKNAKSAFENNCVILAGYDVDKLNTQIFLSVSDLYINHKRIFVVLNLIFVVFHKINRLYNKMLF